MFDVGEQLDGLRCRASEWLVARRTAIVCERRRLHLEELAIIAVLDERGRVDEQTLVRDGMSSRTAHDTLETARRLESLPALAGAAVDGQLSDEQLTEVVRLADPATDEEWAQRAATMPVAELARRARTREKPSPHDSQARRDARHLRMWWTDNHGMLHLRGALADIDGATFETTITALADRMRPAHGQAWDRWEHRAADALVALCDHTRRREPDRDDANEPRLAPRPLFVVDVPLEGPATVAGIPIADTLVEHWRAHADLEAHLVDPDGVTIGFGRTTPALSPKLARAILLRDQQCRACGNRHGLQIHHLQPRSWGGTDDPANLALVCARGPDACHPILVPHGPWALVGNPNLAGALKMIHLDQLTDDQAHQIGLPHQLRNRRQQPTSKPRAGPEAA